LQASFESDIAAARVALLGATFSALVSHIALNGSLDELQSMCERAAAGGASDFAVWSVDAATPPARVSELLEILTQTAATRVLAPLVWTPSICRGCLEEGAGSWMMWR
jgi:hypothetical protein